MRTKKQQPIPREKCPYLEFFWSVCSPNAAKQGPKNFLIWTLSTSCKGIMLLCAIFQLIHCIGSVCIRSFSAPYFSVFRLSNQSKCREIRTIKRSKLILFTQNFMFQPVLSLVIIYLKFVMF